MQQRVLLSIKGICNLVLMLKSSGKLGAHPFENDQHLIIFDLKMGFMRLHSFPHSYKGRRSLIL